MCFPTYCFFDCISTNTVGTIESCCKFNRLAKPGCVFVWPCLCETLGHITSTRTQAIDLAVETKTLDNVFVTICLSVQYQVMTNELTASQMPSEYQAIYSLVNPQQVINAYVYDVVRATVPRMDLDRAFEDKDSIAKEVKETLKIMEQFGYKIIKTLVTDLEPNINVKNAMNEINAAQRMKEAAKEKAMADKVLVVRRAEAQSESKYLSGVGVAKQRKAIIDGLRDSILDWQQGDDSSSPSDVMDLLLLTQYFDMLGIVGQNPSSGTTFVPYPMDGTDKTREALLSGMQR